MPPDYIETHNTVITELKPQDSQPHGVVNRTIKSVTTAVVPPTKGNENDDINESKLLPPNHKSEYYRRAA